MTFWAVERPGQKNERQLVAIGHPAEFFGGNQALGQSRGGDTGGVNPLAVVGDFHQDLPRLVTGLDPNMAQGFLPGSDAIRGRLDAVVHQGVAHHVGQRIGQAAIRD